MTGDFSLAEKQKLSPGPLEVNIGDINKKTKTQHYIQTFQVFSKSFLLGISISIASVNL